MSSIKVVIWSTKESQFNFNALTLKASYGSFISDLNQYNF